MKINLPSEAKQAILLYSFEEKTKVVDKDSFQDIYKKVCSIMSKYGMTSYGFDSFTDELIITPWNHKECYFELHIHFHNSEGDSWEIYMEYNSSNFTEEFTYLTGLSYEGIEKKFKV